MAILQPGRASCVPRAPAVNMNTGCKVGFDYLIKKMPPLLAQRRGCHGDQQAGPKGGQAGANYRGCSEERAHRWPLLWQQACAEGPTLTSWFLKSSWLSGNGAMSVPDAPFPAGPSHTAAPSLSPLAWLNPEPGLGHPCSGCSPKHVAYGLLGAPAGEGWRPEEPLVLVKSAEPDTSPAHGPRRQAWPPLDHLAGDMAGMVMVGGCWHRLAGGVAQFDDFGTVVTQHDW